MEEKTMDEISNFEKVKITYYPEPRGCLSQEASSGLEFSMVDDNNKQISYFFFCKDFINDIVYGTKVKKDMSIYGIRFLHKNYPCTFNSTRILITDYSVDKKVFLPKVNALLLFLNRIEEKLRLKRTKIYEVENMPEEKDPIRKNDYSKSGIYLLEGSRRWQIALPMISLYSLLIRTGLNYNPDIDYLDYLDKVKKNELKSYCDKDSNQVKRAWQGINNILDLGYYKIFSKNMENEDLNYNRCTSEPEVHSGVGICGFSSSIENFLHNPKRCSLQAKFPEWFHSVKLYSEKE